MIAVWFDPVLAPNQWSRLLFNAQKRSCPSSIATLTVVESQGAVVYRLDFWGTSWAPAETLPARAKCKLQLDDVRRLRLFSRLILQLDVGLCPTKRSTIRKECGRTFVVRVDGFAASAGRCPNPGNSSQTVFATTAAKWSRTNSRFRQVTLQKRPAK